MAKLMNLELTTVCCFAVLLMFGSCILASPDPLACEGIKCPPMSELSCPEDSQLREYIDLSSTEITNDTSELVEELLHECCIARKCSCKLCNIPSCHNDSLVIYEVIAETQIPGHCCGVYNCRLEPNCTEVRDTEGFWLTDCQRCKCLYGERICHRSCDEVMPNPTVAYCKSKNLNRFFSHGETWKDGCYECECQNGEEKCVMPFCRSINCPHEKQVTLKGDCCPICWPDTDYPPRHEDDGYYEESDDALLHNPELEEHSSLPPLAPTIVISKPNTTTTTTTSTSTTTTQAPPPPPPPCVVGEDPSATYAVYPEVVEVVRTTNDHNVCLAVIIVVVLLLFGSFAYIYHIQTRKRSYNTVSNSDDNFNNCQKPSLKIKKLGELI